MAEIFLRHETIFLWQRRWHKSIFDETAVWRKLKQNSAACFLTSGVAKASLRRGLDVN